MLLQVSRLKRETDKKAWLGPSMLGWWWGEDPRVWGMSMAIAQCQACFSIYHLRIHTWGKAVNIARLLQSLSILFWGKGNLTEPTASWFSQHSSWMSLREPLVSASLPLRLQTWAAAPGSLCLFSVGARYLTQVILLACQTLYWVFPQAANILLFSYFTDMEVDILRAQAGQLVRGSIETEVKTSDLRTVFHPSCHRTSIPAEHFSAYYNSGWF